MWPEREADHSPPSNGEVQTTWIYTSTHTYVFMAYCLVKYIEIFISTESELRIVLSHLWDKMARFSLCLMCSLVKGTVKSRKRLWMRVEFLLQPDITFGSDCECHAVLWVCTCAVISAEEYKFGCLHSETEETNPVHRTLPASTKQCCGLQWRKWHSFPLSHWNHNALQFLEPKAY
jgi:hypothetical protein